jgi:oligosaccharyltransferase complex subunit alpha (ribophorin I)
VLDLKPRYPLLGGWNYSFTLGWDSPLADSAGWDEKSGKYVVGVPVMTLIPGAVVDEAEVKIILPEGATYVSTIRTNVKFLKRQVCRDMEAFSPFPETKSSISTHTTYLDTTGRPAIKFEYKQLTDQHTGTIYVSPFNIFMC